jgi:hypothetical protein
MKKINWKRRWQQVLDFYNKFNFTLVEWMVIIGLTSALATYILHILTN